MKKLLLVTLMVLSVNQTCCSEISSNYNTLLQQSQANQRLVDQSILAMPSPAKKNAILRLKATIENQLGTAPQGSDDAAIAIGKAQAFNIDFPAYAITI